MTPRRAWLLLFTLPLLGIGKCNGQNGGLPEGPSPAPSSSPPPAVAPKTVFRFDMGPEGASPAAGFSAITPADGYSAAAGYGWSSNPAMLSAVQRSKVPDRMPHTAPDALLTSAINSPADATFRVDVPAGSYDVVAWIGDVGDPIVLQPGQLSGIVTPLDHLDILANGTTVVADAFARTLTMKAQFGWSIGGFKRLRFRADAAGGHLDVGFHCDNTATSFNSIMGLEVYPHAAPVIALDPATGALSSPQALLAPALTAFNAADYAGARTLINALGDPLAKAWGLAWLTGWLSGEEQEVDDAALAQAQSLLESLASPDSPNVRFLLEDIRDFRLGWHYQSTRGYSFDAVPAAAGNLGEMLANLSAGLQLFEQIQHNLTDGGYDSAALPSPLGFEAVMRIAMNLWSRDTLAIDPAGDYEKYWRGIVNGLLGSHAALFPKSAELKVFQVVASDKYAVDGGIVGSWNPADLPAFNPANTWWASQTELADDPAAPAWANAERKYWKAYRNAGTWWMSHRLVADELGGGDGDDVEAAALAYPLVPKDEGPTVLSQGMTAMLEKVLFSPAINADEGYYKFIADVEHSAEYTSNPLWFLTAVKPADPVCLDFAARTMRNMDGALDAMPWTALLPGQADARSFKGHNLGATGATGGDDIPMNLRAIRPGFALTDYNHNTRALALTEQLARAWRLYAMSTASGKPAGIFPEAVTAGAPPIFGTGGKWWMSGGYYDLLEGEYVAIQYNGALYNLLLGAYRTSTANDRKEFLLPVLTAGVMVYDIFRTPGADTSVEGSAAWASNLLKVEIANALTAAKADYESEPTLTAVYPTAKLNWVIGTYASAYARLISGGGGLTATATSVGNSFKNSHTWLRNFWPLATDAVAFTDRIYHSVQQSHSKLFEVTQGGRFVLEGPPSPAISWVNPAAGTDELDIAVFVSMVKKDRLELWLYNFDTEARDTGVRIWRQLGPGTWEVYAGADVDQNNAIDLPSVFPIVSFTYSAPGQTVILPALKPGKLLKIEFRRTAEILPPPVSIQDPAISTRDIAVNADGSVSVTVHNLGAVDSAGGVVQVLQDGVIVGSSALPSVPTAFLNLSPAPKTVVVPTLGSFVPGAAFTVRLDLSGAPQLSTLNDEVLIQP